MKPIYTVITGWLLAALAAFAMAAPTTESAAPAEVHAADYSGIECVTRALHQVGRAIDPLRIMGEDQLRPAGITTIEDLRRAIGEQGAYATILPDMTVQELTETASPVILHVQGNQFSSQADHFVLHLGTREHQARIVNPPDPEVLIPYPLLMTRWHGEALVVSADESRPGLTVPYRRSMTIPYSVAGLLALTAAAGTYAWRRFRPATARQSQGFLRSAGRGIGLLAAGGALGIAWHSRGQGDFLARAAVQPPQNAAALVDFVGKVDTTAEAPIPKVDYDTAVRLLAEGVLFVDARDPGEYAAGHIKGAINVSAGGGRQVKLDLAGIPYDRRIVVYCVSAECGKADYVAAVLRQEGYVDVSVYPDGWTEWKGPKSQ